MPSYNERAWAIDVISEINRLALEQRRAIRRASGERTILRAGATALFPDVLLYGDTETGRLLQGWELKFPDTDINDAELVRNAAIKAEVLGLETFVLWNVTVAVMYGRTSDDTFELKHRWPSTTIRTRESVAEADEEWKALLHSIIGDLNGWFERGELRSVDLPSALDENAAVAIMTRNTGAVANALRAACQEDGALNARIQLWWRSERTRHAEREPWIPLGRHNLFLWVNRLLFAKLLQRVCSAATAAEELGPSPDDGVRVFEEISASCDFAHIFRPGLGDAAIDQQTWEELRQFNSLLVESAIESLPAAVLQELLERATAVTRRKVAGQYTTPAGLAGLLVRLSLTDRTGFFLDPCAGSGTFPRAALDQKLEAGIPRRDAVERVWASDKFSFYLQLVMLAITDPESMGLPAFAFTGDIADLVPGMLVDFIDPESGEPFTQPLPLFQAIASNLPFVRFEDIPMTNPRVRETTSAALREVGVRNSLPNKSDLYAYLPFLCWHLLASGGRAGFILSNSWLATGFGAQFRDLLRRLYRIEYVLISGKGRWFSEADVVTTALILARRDSPVETSADLEETKFVVIQRTVADLADTELNAVVASELLVNHVERENATVHRLTSSRISELEALGLEWPAFFADTSWLPRLGGLLCPVSEYFEIIRGERRGWNALFYPDAENEIEEDYLRPVLRHAANLTSLNAVPDATAFVCAATKDQLEERGHEGALAWIERFENATNETGQPLVEVLARARLHWYEMNENATADLVTLINPDERMFVARFANPTFIDQRFTGLQAKQGTDAPLIHALMNSAIGVYYIEAIGFGRGLGVLDLNTTRVRNNLRVLDPGRLNAAQRKRILAAFEPLLNRPPAGFEDETGAADRRHFNEVVFAEYGVHDALEAVETSLLELFQIRKSVQE